MMTRTNAFHTTTSRLLAVSTTLVLAAPLTATAQSRARNLVLEAGTVIPLRLNTSLSSKDSQKGDTFYATIRRDNGSDTNTFENSLPDGTRIEGVVRAVRPKRDKDAGELDLAFRRIKLPDGRTYPVSGSLIGLDNKSVERSSDGRLIAKPGHQNDRLIFAGYGAGAGLLVGALTKKPLEGTLIGGGLGYLFSTLQKGKSNTRDVTLNSGSELGMRVDRQVALDGGADYSRDADARLHRRNRQDGINPDNANDSLNNNRDGYVRDEGNRDGGSDTTTRRNRDDNGDLNGRRNRNDSSLSDTRQSATDIGVLVGDRDVTFTSTARPVMSRNNVVLLPLRQVMDAARIPFTYDATNKQIRATGDSGSVRLALNSTIAVVNGSRRVRLDASAQRLNGTLYVPAKFISLLTGRDTTYDAGSRTVEIPLRDTSSNSN